MGDIYHAGEVYAGSVPIDDTQASENTVYSSAKVEAMMEEVQEDIHPSTDDTDYQTLTLKTGFTGNTKIKRVGKLVTLIFGVNSGLGSSWAYITDDIPAKYKPIQNLSFSIISSAGDVGLGQIEISGTSCKIGGKSSATNGYATVTYLV